MGHRERPAHPSGAGGPTWSTSQLDEPLEEGGEYVRTSKPLPFVRAVEAVWVAERLEDLKEASFRCAHYGHLGALHAHPGAGPTLWRLESGMDPTTLRWRLMNTWALFLKDWIVKVLDALPGEVAARRLARRD